ncbi:nucleotide exchange factor GrpE [Saccharopolyspora indica]|uniref:nucleotide exchange factor GrpE n=1 Tax=Saccharopolyspora indica TaxID=1229659 RepID=UPI0022EA6207|nr:nucleotide exchange factor GrpE [Saccharopolyspora indica]MDA3646420.1 nucleotide exchange factor GrpE [Saccharopolyspora indica]
MRDEPEQDDQREGAAVLAPADAPETAVPDTAESETAVPETADPEAPDEPAEELPEADPVAELTGAVSALAEQIREHHDRAAARERVIDKLHAEVERLRAGEQNLLLRPITTDLQNLRKDLLHQARALPPEPTREQVADLLESFALSAEQALERCGSAPIRPEIGAEFSAREHRAVKILPAEEPDQHERIALVVSDGYLDTTTDRVSVPARVHVYRWSATTGDSPRAEGMNADV